MPQPNVSDFSDYRPRKESHTRLPITNLPIGAVAGENDPTLGIRSLIEQLQASARAAQSDLRKVEVERDQLYFQVQQAHEKVEELRANEQEMRSRFTEVSSILRERDQALQQLDRQSRAAREAEAKLASAARERSDAEHQRQEAARQRDEAMQRIDALNRTIAETSGRSAEWQKQLQTLRQARDAAHAQNLELTNRLGRSEDEVAELGYQREAAKKAQQQAESDASDFRRQLAGVTLARDENARQVEQLSRELDEQRNKLLDLAEEKTAVAQTDDEQAAVLAEARGQVLRLSQERDSARAQAHEHAAALEELRAKFQSFREEEAKTASGELAETHEKLTAFEAAARESRHESANLRQQLIATREQLAAVQQAAEQARGLGEATQAQIEAAAREQEVALTSLNAAQKQIERLIRDRDSIRSQATEKLLEAEDQLNAVRAELAAVQSAQEETEGMRRELSLADQRLAKQRLESIDIATQLQASQREVRELSATLAEARLQVKFFMSQPKAIRPASERPPEITELTIAELHEIPEEVAFAELDPLPLTGEEPLNERAAKGALGAMRHCFQSYMRNPKDLSLLNELYCHVLGFSERARTSNYVALHRLCHAFAEFTQGLYQTPEQINSSTLRTVTQTIEFLGSLMKERGLAQFKDPAKAHVYVVDDDEENCHCIQLALQQQMMRTSISQDPSLALMELAGGRYDLIMLDVSMPGMDGFALCKSIRELPLHANTPVVFLTGLSTIENRVQSTLCGGNEFIAKPFSLNELSVKVLSLILRSELAGN